MSAPSTLDTARTKVLERGEGLSEAEILEVLSIDDEHLTELLELAHEVRIKHCGVEVSLEGIISLKTGGCPEDCHFCSQSGLFESPVRAVRLNIEELVEGARQSAKMGASEFCIVAAVKGPTERLLDQVKDAIAAINAEVDISISASLGILSRDQARQLRGGHGKPERGDRAQLRFAGGTELALGDDGTEKGLLGGANAIIGGNYLTTAGRPIEADRDAVDRVTSLGIPAVYDTIKAL
ncbi:biotin synthase BioB [Corynebacterium sanguinis]